MLCNVRKDPHPSPPSIDRFASYTNISSELDWIIAIVLSARRNVVVPFFSSYSTVKLCPPFGIKPVESSKIDTVSLSLRAKIVVEWRKEELQRASGRTKVRPQEKEEDEKRVSAISVRQSNPAIFMTRRNLTDKGGRR